MRPSPLARSGDTGFPLCPSPARRRRLGGSQKGPQASLAGQSADQCWLVAGPVLCGEAGDSRHYLIPSLSW